MTVSFQQSLRRAGSHFTMGCQQQRCVAPGLVAVSIWNKTGAGDQT